MTAIINNRGAIASEDDVINHLGDIEEYVKMRKRFNKTIKLKFGYINKVVVVKRELFRSDKGDFFTIIMPRFLPFKKPYSRMFHTVEPPKFRKSRPLSTEPKQIFTPREFQQVAADYILDNFLTNSAAAAGNAGVILELEAGCGKTFVAALVFARLRVRTLYVVPNQYLLKQAMEDFRKCFGDSIKIGEYSSKKKKDGDIVFAIINSLENFKCTDPKSADVSKSVFELSIWDEVHEYATKKRSAYFNNVFSKYILGLTAEANSRADKLDFIVHNHCGPVVIANEIPGFSVPMTERFTSNIRIISYKGPEEHCQNIVGATGMMSACEMSKQLCRDPYRTTMILDELVRLCGKGHNVFLWCDLRSTVSMFKTLLSNLKLYNEDKTDDEVSFGCLMGSLTDAEIKSAQKSRVIIATYQYAYRGVSLPNFDAMIFVSPRRAKIYQTLKRIYRMGGDPTVTRQVVDIVDVKTKLKAQLSTRMLEYKKDIFGAEIIKEKISYDDIVPKKEVIDFISEFTAESETDSDQNIIE